MEIINVDSLEEVPENFTGVVKDRYVSDGAIFATLYYWKGMLHRVDGPAITYASGLTYWYFKGEKVTPQQLFEQLTVEQKEKAIWNLDEWK